MPQTLRPTENAARRSRQGRNRTARKRDTTERRKKRVRPEDGAGNEEGNREYTEGSAGEVKGKNERGAEDRKINGKC